MSGGIPSVTIPENQEEVLRERFGDPEILDGRAICGLVLKHNKEGRCMLDPGWGTIHLGFGPCKHHGGDTGDLRMAPVDTEAYSSIVKYDRLRKALSVEESRENLDNLDGEIILIRAMIRVTAEDFGLALNDDGEVVQSSNPGAIRGHALEITTLIDRLTSSIKRKYEVLQIAGETIPRERVRSYINQLQLILNQTLRDQCQFCSRTHNLRSMTFDALALLGDI
jgi:hypothetical protein